MSDIVERLRSAPGRLLNLGPNAERLMAEAATEIERLRPFEKFYNDAVAAETRRRENVAGWRR
jgi:hypothetical protein